MSYRTGFDEPQGKKKIEGEHGSSLQVFKGHLPKEGVQTGGSDKREDT